MATLISLASSFYSKTSNKSTVAALSSPHQIQLRLFSPRRQTLKLYPSSSQTPLTSIKCVPTESSSPKDESTESSKNEVIEHIVLFKMKYGFCKYDYTRFIQAMNSLKCLPGVQYLSSGYIKDIYCASLKEYTVFLHSRHASKEHLDIYMTHPLKHAFTMTYTEPFFEDYMLVDYVHAYTEKLVHPKKGHALRTIFIKLQDGWAGSGISDEEKKKQQQVKDDVKEKIKESLKELKIPVNRMTFGEAYEGNGYPAAHKNFKMGVLASYPKLEHLEALLRPQEFALALVGKLTDAKVPLVPEHSVVVVDYGVNEFYNCETHDLFGKEKERERESNMRMFMS